MELSVSMAILHEYICFGTSAYRMFGRVARKNAFEAMSRVMLVMMILILS